MQLHYLPSPRPCDTQEPGEDIHLNGLVCFVKHGHDGKEDESDYDDAVAYPIE